MRKGIFTKDVEDQAAIAKRLSHAVNDGLAGTIAMASQSAQNAKRVRELQKDYGLAAETPTERYRAF